MRTFICAASKAAKVKLKVTFEPYARYTSSGYKTATVSGDDLLSALKKMCDNMQLYIDSDYIEEEEMSADDVIEKIERSNGDGCDFILNLTNLTTGETLIEEDGGYAEEDWDNE